MAIEKEFQQEMIANYQAIQKQTGCKTVRMLQTIEKFGAVKTAKEIIRKNRLSDDFENIQAKGCIGLTMEAMIVKSKYGTLFTDDEVNHCYELMCEYGHYQF